MIAFVTNYDENTNCNYMLYSHLSISPNVELLDASAVAFRLNQESQTERRNVFAMSHGTEDILKDQDRMAAIDSSNIANFSDMSVFSYACNTSINLGRVASESGCTWYGYNDRINVPEPDEELIPMYSVLFEFIVDNFPNGNSRNSIENFINELKGLCEIKINELDAMNVSGQFAPTSGAYQSVHQLWGKLQVWLANDSQYIMHAEADPPIFRW
ncbi:hypothetical protein [Vibrio splendidus]|uniref:hypothetical protein n=1 Tax=Vibrio splendidus TaxID=29497 RepID=UPI0034A0B9FC